MTASKFNKEFIKQSIRGKLQRYNGRTLKKPPAADLLCRASTVRDHIMTKWTQAREDDKTHEGKRLYYLTIEILLGHSLFNNVLNLGAVDVYTKALTELELSWEDIEPREPEPGLATAVWGADRLLHGQPGHAGPACHGMHPAYEFGLFKPKLTGGQQAELPDDWLEHGNVWEVPHTDDTFEVRFEGRVEQRKVNGHVYYDR